MPPRNSLAIFSLPDRTVAHLNDHQWTREESLTDVRVAEMVELPEPLVIASQVGAEETESFGSRLQRQLADAQVSPIGAALS